MRQVLEMTPIPAAILAIIASTVALAPHIPAPAHGRRPAADSLRPADFRLERLTAYRDSFEVLAYDPVSDRDRPSGWRRASMTLRPDGFLYG